jgi:hypothetical protein
MRRREFFKTAGHGKNDREKDSKVTAVITCSTDGASIGYRLNNNDRWELCAKPINVKAGGVLEAKAIRIGYEESKVTRFTP